MGLPVVSTDVAGAKELVEDQQTGFIVPQQAHEKLADRITSLLDNPEKRMIMGLAGRRRVEEHFSFSQRLRRIEGLYEEIVNKRLTVR